MPSDTAAPWLATMRELAGVKEYPGGENNPTILGWARFIGGAWPEMAAYAALYKSDDIAWCGLTTAYALAKNGVRPPFGSTDVERFLWANSFPGWGLRLDEPRPGCFVVFKWPSGGGHVGLLDRVEGRTLWVLGGNQSDAVNLAPFAWDKTVVGFFWSPQVAATPSAVRTSSGVRRRMGKAITLAEARRDRNGNLSVYYLPANDGGGAYEVAGINVRYHPVAAAKLKTLIEAGRYQEAEDFVGDYTGSYTDVADLWTSSWGIEFYLRDCVFNRGPTGAAKILQRALLIRGDTVGPDGVDGDVGPNTMAAIGRQEADVEALLVALRKAREDYEREDVGYRANFWNGLINRFNSALTTARQFQIEQAKELPVSDPTSDQVIKEMQALRSDIAQLTTSLGALVSAIKGAVPAPPPIAEPKVEPKPEPAPQPAPPAATPILQQPGVGIGVLGGVLTAVLQALGIVGPMTGEAATTTGQLLPILSAGSVALGATGTLGSVLNALGTVASLFLQKKPQT